MSRNMRLASVMRSSRPAIVPITLAPARASSSRPAGTQLLARATSAVPRSRTRTAGPALARSPKPPARATSSMKSRSSCDRCLGRSNDQYAAPSTRPPTPAAPSPAPAPRTPGGSPRPGSERRSPRVVSQITACPDRQASATAVLASSEIVRQPSSCSSAVAARRDEVQLFADGDVQNAGRRRQL